MGKSPTVTNILYRTFGTKSRQNTYISTIFSIAVAADCFFLYNIDISFLLL